MEFRVKELTFKETTDATADAEAVIFAKAKHSLMWFTIATMITYVVNWHHKVIAKYLMRWINKEDLYVILTMPPRHGKTELASIRTPAFILGINPDAQIIGTSYGSAIASRVNREIQKVIDSRAFKLIFPDTFLNNSEGRTTKGQALRNNDIFEIVGRRGSYRAAGIGGPIGGAGADYLIVDDPIKNNKEADSPTYRQHVWDWFTSTALTRLERNGSCLVITTRWHEDDLVGRILNEMKNNPDFPKFKLVNFEGIKETQTMTEDLRQMGEPLWNWKYPIEKLKALKAALGSRWFNALYQQRPTALEGGIFKLKYFKYWTMETVPKKFERIIMSVDAAFTESDTSDYVVIQIWGKAASGYYLLDQVRERMDYVKTKKEIKRMAAKWPQAFKKIIEKKANGDALLSDLKDSVMGLTPYTPKESKVSRANAVVSAFEDGLVHIPDPSSPAFKWVEDYLAELTVFDNGANDDQVDATTQALIDLHGRSGSWLAGLIKD